MCDKAKERGLGWRGWMPLPARQETKPLGPWLDLTHPIDEAMPRVPTFGPPKVKKLFCLPADPLTVTSFEMVVHTGTHVDAPCHFYSDGPSMEQVPLERWNGPGVVWRFDLPPNSLLEPEHLEAARPLLRPGDILALDTGSSPHINTPAYDAHPCLSLAAADWIVAKQVKLLACDFPTPDLPVHRRPAEGFTWPVHQRLLRDGVLICEHLRGPRPLAGKRVEFIFGALSITGSDGAPARVMAREIAD